MAPEKKDGKILEEMSILYVSFRALQLWWKRRKQKQGGRRNDSGSSEEDGKESSNNNYGISFWIVFNSPEYGNSWFAEHISREFLTAEFDLISYKAIRSRGRLTILYLFIVNTVIYVVCSIAIYLPFIQVISISQNFLGNWNKSPLGATAQSRFIVLKDHK